MDMSNTTAVEFLKLELFLLHTADDAVECIETLEANLAAFDTRRGLNFMNASKCFMNDCICEAKDAALNLRHVSHQIAKCKFPSESEIAAARNMMSAASNAMDGLKKVARAYDELNGKSNGITRIIDNVLAAQYDKKRKDDQDSSMLTSANTVEIVVKSTLRNTFSGFSALKHQISTAERSLSLSVVQRAKQVVGDVVVKLKGGTHSPRNLSALTC
ncbi:hypothetical protein PsorP6_009022 [Peronosclerospora sorghi]|uniref:Uncharacterized protein n=1 Tax=Peronosclerospora sorghi TaxID=230839 RepID=A0ACC0VZE5_9STRA|nr:hypothetical protein PsorP6_009022 [Peronosclerospora sorghi]